MKEVLYQDYFSDPSSEQMYSLPGQRAELYFPASFAAEVQSCDFQVSRSMTSVYPITISNMCFIKLFLFRAGWVKITMVTLKASVKPGSLSACVPSEPPPTRSPMSRTVMLNVKSEQVCMQMVYSLT